PSRTPRNQYRLDIFLGVPTIGIHPKSPVFMRVGEVLQVRLNTHVLSVDECCEQFPDGSRLLC
ncbi:hypothetical protein, partial [Roseateles koreensis]